MSSDSSYVPGGEGMLAYLIAQINPKLAARITASGRIETAVIGLGRQGTRHAGLMKEFGTTVTAAVAPGRGGATVHQDIPVYNSVGDMLRKHPHVAGVSVWRHYSTAADATIEAIHSGIPLVVLITEGMPVRDVRRTLAAAREHKTLLLGPNTPGVIFPPEHVKIGMLPDVFYPAEREGGSFGPEGVTICSRSGAILYHMSDALASGGIAQNAVIGIGGDSVVGTPFARIVPLAINYPKTDLLVVAGEIGGCQEEMLAEDIKANPERYPKPIVALISGRCAPQGKTMGHAGAIVAPGSEYGTFASKKAALESAGVTVVNSQRGLIQAVQKALSGKTYFSPERYYARMREIWEAPPPLATWPTQITRVAPNDLAIRGKPLTKLIGRRSLLEVTALLVTGRFPRPAQLKELERLAMSAAKLPPPRVSFNKDDDVSKKLAGMLLGDKLLGAFEGSEIEKTAYCLGRTTACFGKIFNAPKLAGKDFATLSGRAIAGRSSLSVDKIKMMEAITVACVDHGVTPPSCQATILASTARASFEVAVANGICAITDVHGGAGERAACFFVECAELSRAENLSARESAEKVISARTADNRRIEGLGHRVHTLDPRRDVLWRLAARRGLSGPCCAISKVVSDAFKTIRGMSLPINVDGVIGAIIADMNLDYRTAKALFIFGRIGGLAAHHFEEIATQPPMRRVNFDQAIYAGN